MFVPVIPAQDCQSKSRSCEQNECDQGLPPFPPNPLIISTHLQIRYPRGIRCHEQEEEPKNDKDDS
jgi:hypothetical protein